MKGQENTIKKISQLSMIICGQWKRRGTHHLVGGVGFFFFF